MGRLLRKQSKSIMNNLTILPIPVLQDNYVWAIIDKNQSIALIIDPGEAIPVSVFLKQQQLKLVGILITHHHWDHTNGIEALKKEYDTPVFGPANETIPGMTMPLQEEETVSIQGFPLSFKVISIPGHTLGHIAYYFPGMLFCGDTLFASGCGRIFEGTPAQMYESLQEIAALPHDTKIYCAHEYTLNNLRFAKLVEPNNPAIMERIKEVTDLRQQGLPSLPSTLHAEKETNPFLRCRLPQVIASVENYAGEPLKDELDVFTRLRQWKDNFK